MSNLGFTPNVKDERGFLSIEPRPADGKHPRNSKTRSSYTYNPPLAFSPLLHPADVLIMCDFNCVNIIKRSPKRARDGHQMGKVTEII